MNWHLPREVESNGQRQVQRLNRTLTDNAADRLTRHSAAFFHRLYTLLALGCANEGGKQKRATWRQLEKTEAAAISFSPVSSAVP